MSFDWPWALLALAVIPALLAAYVAFQRHRPKVAVRFTNLDLLANVVSGSPQWRRHVPAALYLGALAALLFSLARPQFVESTPKQEGTVVLVTDVSGSMTATDIDPSRMAAAKEAARTLVDELPEDFRVGLIAFSSGVRVLAAPTTDRDAVRQAIERLTPVGGTAMGDAIVAGVDSVKAALAETADAAATPTPTPTAPAGDGEGDEPPAIIVLLSDGANTLGEAEPLDAAQLAAESGIPVFTIALGTADGVATVYDQFGQQRRIPVPPDEATLEQIAATTGGTSFVAPSAEELKSIYTKLGERIGYDEEETEISWLFAAAGAALMVAGAGAALAWSGRFP